ncbi:MAG: COG4648 family protein [Polaromonas sp.]
MKQACRWAAVIALGLAYSVLAYLAAASDAPTLLGALVAIVPLMGLALVMAWRASQRVLMLALFVVACAILYGISGWLVAHYIWVFFLQHAGVYALLCAAFGRTLLAGQTPMISRFARIVHGGLSPALVRYTRSVTWAWTFYFGGIAGLSLLLFWLAPIAVWSAFANLLGIPLLVLMFVGEYAVRWRVLPAADRAGPLDAIRAYRQANSEDKARQA